MHCVIVEWSDGTVGTNGPYADSDSAATAALKLAQQLAAESSEIVTQADESGTYTVGDPDNDPIWVYSQEMGDPVEV